MTFKKIDFGEYVVTIEYKENGELKVIVYDEGGEIIDLIKVTIDEDDIDESNHNNEINLN